MKSENPGDFLSSEYAFTDGQLLDFDFAALDFFDWVEAKQEEEVIGKRSANRRKLREDEMYVRKYSDMASIFREYYADETPVIRDPTKTGDPLVDDLSIEDVMAGWSPNE